MGLDTSIQEYVESLNDLSYYRLHEIIEIFEQAKAPDWYEAMLHTNLDIFEITCEESVSYFKSLENLEKTRRTNGPCPVSIILFQYQQIIRKQGLLPVV
jgi:hypothetical protein